MYSVNSHHRLEYRESGKQLEKRRRKKLQEIYTVNVASWNVRSIKKTAGITSHIKKNHNVNCNITIIIIIWYRYYILSNTAPLNNAHNRLEITSQ